MSKDEVLNLIVNQSPNLSWIKNKTFYIVRHGSFAYGTNVPTSDIDIRGICAAPKEYYLGFLNNFEQAELHNPDVTIFELIKFIKLATDSNPNCLELLFVEPEDHIYVGAIGQELLDNRDLFLSKKVHYTMRGYAISQAKRIQLHRRYFLNPPKTPPTRKELGLPEQTLIPVDQLAAANAAIQKELDKLSFDFMDDLSEDKKIGIREIMSNMLSEMKILSDDQWMAAARKIGMDDNLIMIMQRERQYSTLKREWDQYQHWKKNRNPERAAMEEKYGFDGKFGLHLVRLYRQCKDMLTTGKLTVKRPDAEELISIRNGAWSYEKLMEFMETEDRVLNELYLNSTALPKAPDREKIDNLCVSLLEKSLSEK